MHRLEVSGAVRPKYGSLRVKWLNILVKRQEMLHKFFLLVPFIVIEVRNTLEDLLVVLNDIAKVFSFFHFRKDNMLTRLLCCSSYCI